jgi:hypothetical protein
MVLFAVAIGVGLLVTFSGVGRVFAAAWLVAAVWCAGFYFAFEVVLTADGDVTFRSLLRSRVVGVASVTKVKKAYGPEGNSYFVVRYRGGRVSIGDGKDEVALVRRLVAMNPDIEIDPRIFK